MLRRFLDTFGFDYEFASATEYYKAGKFDAMLRRAAERYDAIMAVMLPTLGEERQATYSPFLPISPTTGRVLYVPMKEVDAKNGTITFADEDGRDTTLPVTGGHVKLQWKPDFGMRWAALGVDFEMFGKDHQTNAVVYDKICEILGGLPPEHYVYELFLDDKGQKISKSKGNGLTIDEWLTYADTESLSLYMYNRPREAKKLYFDVIPRAVDEYAQFQNAYGKQELKDRLMNPLWHIHGGNPPPPEEGSVSFSLLLNLVAVANTEDKSVLWAFLKRYAPQVSQATHPRLDSLVGYAIRYFTDFVKPNKKYRRPRMKSARRLRICRRPWRNCRKAPPRKPSSRRSMTSAGANPTPPYRRMAPSAWRKPGSTCSIRFCSAKNAAPASAPSRHLYGVENTRALIGKALKGELTGSPR